MRNNDLIATAVCAQYTPEQLHKLAAHYYTADEIASAAAKIIVEPGEDGTAPDPVEIALFSTRSTAGKAPETAG